VPSSLLETNTAVLGAKNGRPAGHVGVDDAPDSRCLGPLHGYGLARRIEQISGDLLAVNQGTLYPALLKLEQEGAIAPSGAPRRIIAGRGSID
jgi:hypothetical protein